ENVPGRGAAHGGGLQERAGLFGPFGLRKGRDAGGFVAHGALHIGFPAGFPILGRVGGRFSLGTLLAYHAVMAKKKSAKKSKPKTTTRARGAAAKKKPRASAARAKKSVSRARPKPAARKVAK